MYVLLGVKQRENGNGKDIFFFSSWFTHHTQVTNENQYIFVKRGRRKKENYYQRK